MSESKQSIPYKTPNLFYSRMENLSPFGFFNPHFRVVIRLTGDGIGAARNQNIGFGPVGLERPGFHGSDLNHAVHFTRVGVNDDVVPILEFEAFGVYG